LRIACLPGSQPENAKQTPAKITFKANLRLLRLGLQSSAAGKCETNLGENYVQSQFEAPSAGGFRSASRKMRNKANLGDPTFHVLLGPTMNNYPSRSCDILVSSLLLGGKRLESFFFA
jgi:hypothetical protein